MTIALPAAPQSAHLAPGSIDQILRLVIALAGAVASVNGLNDLSAQCSDLTRLLEATPAGLTSLVSAVLHAILGFAAVAVALSRHLPYGIMALALLMLAKWASDLPSVINHGLGLAGDPLVVTHRLFRSVLLPVIALAAIAAARSKRNFVLAAIAAILPGLIEIAGIAAFAISLGAPVL